MGHFVNSSGGFMGQPEASLFDDDDSKLHGHADGTVGDPGEGQNLKSARPPPLQVAPKAPPKRKQGWKGKSYKRPGESLSHAMGQMADQGGPIDSANGQDPTCTCPTGKGKTTRLIIADSEMGSTWLVQLLDRHPCSDGFVPGKHTRPDGKYHPDNKNELVQELKHWKDGGAHSAHGIMLHYKTSETFVNKLPGAGTLRAGTNFQINFQVILMWREPFFMGLSRLKKNIMLGAPSPPSPSPKRSLSPTPARPHAHTPTRPHEDPDMDHGIMATSARRLYSNRMSSLTSPHGRCRETPQASLQ